MLWAAAAASPSWACWSLRRQVSVWQTAFVLQTFENWVNVPRSPCVQCCPQQCGGELAASPGTRCRHEHFLRSSWCRSGAVRLHQPGARAGRAPCLVPVLCLPAPGCLEHGCAAQRHRLTQSCSKSCRCREERPERDPEARASCGVRVAPAQGLGSESSACLLQKHLKRGTLVSLLLHDTCL